MDSGLYDLPSRSGRRVKAPCSMLVTAESCTGGWIGEAVTMVPGSSDWYERGFITYTYISKREMLGVRAETLEQHGAVSEQTVKEMVAGALAASHAQIAVAVSGIAGPAGGTPDEAGRHGVSGMGAQERRAGSRDAAHFAGDREAVRRQAVERALAGVLELIR